MSRSAKYSVKKVFPAPQPKRKLSNVSAVSSLYFSDAGNSRQKLEEKLEVLSGGAWERVKDVLKLVGIVMPLCIAVAAIAWITLSQATKTMNEADNLEEHIQKAQLIKTTVLGMQRERGMSCVFLSSESNTDIIKNLEKFRAQVDNEFKKLLEQSIVSQAEGIMAELQLHRASVYNRSVDCLQNLKWYTDSIDTLLGHIQKILREGSDMGVLWNTIAAYTAALKAVDLVGIKRAMGSSFFAAGFFDERTYSNFLQISGGANYLFQLSWNSYPEGGEQLEELKKTNEKLFTNNEKFQSMIGRSSGDPDPAKGLAFFEHMTQYIAVLMQIEKSVSRDLFLQLGEIHNQSSTRYYIAISIIAASLFLCPMAIIVYIFQAQKMMKKIRNFTETLSDKTAELNAEKKKTDMLLMQLLPVSIVKTLKQGKSVEAETFDLVTIYFSDIVGFTTLSSRCTPMEVVDLLNELYTKCDGILDQYDVYKVETIGDAYMVASGLPRRNGNKHTNEVATMALDILQMMEKFKIPHVDYESLLMRIGIHTGSCAAGIVGSKMPRYCLFGDTVNTASRMESTGLGLRIQMSEDTRNHLITNFPEVFDIMERGKCAVKGKGSMDTYWLLGKEGFPYKINLENAEKKVAKTMYWKSDVAEEIEAQLKMMDIE